MLFTTYEFWLFFCLVFVGVHLLAHRGQNILLLVASYVFYGAWDWRFLGLIFFSTVVDYFAARFASPDNPNGRVRKFAVTASVLVNLGILGVFKYFDFFAVSFAQLLGISQTAVDPILLNIILPVGISFYTFQTMSYTLDVHAGRLTATKSFSDLALYVAFFPQLVAGPIERGTQLMPQVTAQRKIDTSKFPSAISLIIWGLFKKICIADALAYPVQVVYASLDPTGGEVYLATVCFAIQIYCDFSGYTDIARGLSRLLGFELMLNFNLPYIAKNPSDFWRRWHISLSTWLRDYLYIPLGGNRLGPKRTYVNLMITMILGGLWHGARFNFVLWGIYHGALLAVHRLVSGRSNRARKPDSGLVMSAKVLGMFQLTLCGWLLFRVESMSQLSHMVWALLHSWTHWQSTLTLAKYALPAILPLLAMQIWQVSSRDVEILGKTPWAFRTCVLAFCLSCVLLLNRGGGVPFIYFQF